MKSIKSFKLFEEMTVRDFSKEIDEFLYIFGDLGYEIQNRYQFGGAVHIIHGSCKFHEIKDELLSLISYINSVIRIQEIEFCYKLENEFNDHPNQLMTKFYTINYIGKNEFRDNMLSRINDNTVILGFYICI